LEGDDVVGWGGGEDAFGYGCDAGESVLRYKAKAPTWALATDW
jgi:hypothetical protein